MTETSKPVPCCPACRSSATHHEQGKRHQCDRCGWRFVVLADGSTWRGPTRMQALRGGKAYELEG